MPALQTDDADRDAQDRLQHVVITYDQFRGRRIYVDGRFTADADPPRPARLWNWDPTTASCWAPSRAAAARGRARSGSSRSTSRR